MTDNSTTDDTTTAPTDPEPSVEAPDGTVEAPEADAPTEDGDDDHGGNREAAKYRRRLRDVEAERDGLLARLETMQRTEAERLAAKHLAKGAALWIGETSLADVLDADGNVDPVKVANRAQTVRDEYGVEKARRGLYVPGEGENPTVRSKSNGMLDVVMGK